MNADVLSAATDASSSPPYASIGAMRSIGKRSANSLPNAVVSGETAEALTTSRPECTALSKPQYESVSMRRFAGGTGHPGCHDPDTIAASTGATDDWNAGPATRRVETLVRARVVEVVTTLVAAVVDEDAGGSVDVVVVDVVDVARFALT